jgi:uncharacterized protein (UPF0333 family)
VKRKKGGTAHGRISLGIGGSSAKTDRSYQLDAMNKMKNVFNFALPQAEGQQAKGTASMDKAGDYWSKILSGNRSAVDAAVAPEANATRTAADASKRQLATSGTARGGGTAGTNQQIDDATRAKIDNSIFAARPEAAKETASIGKTELSDASSLLGLSSETATNLADISMKSRGQSQKINQEMVGKVTSAIDNAMLALFA